MKAKPFFRFFSFNFHNSPFCGLLQNTWKKPLYYSAQLKTFLKVPQKRLSHICITWCIYVCVQPNTTQWFCEQYGMYFRRLLKCFYCYSFYISNHIFSSNSVRDSDLEMHHTVHEQSSVSEYLLGIFKLIVY